MDKFRQITALSKRHRNGHGEVRKPHQKETDRLFVIKVPHIAFIVKRGPVAFGRHLNGGIHIFNDKAAPGFDTGVGEGGVRENAHGLLRSLEYKTFVGQKL